MLLAILRRRWHRDDLKGMYLICDNEYLTWLTMICPNAHFDSTSLEGFFSTNLESMRKDVECMFGILKKRWRVLNNGILFCDIDVCNKVFTTCCCLHNFLLNLMERHNTRVGRGARLCIPSEFRRIPTEVGQKSPAGTEWSRNKQRNVL